MGNYTKIKYASNILTSRGFQKGITCLGSVLSWPRKSSSASSVVYFGQYGPKNLELRIEDWGLRIEQWGAVRSSEDHEVHNGWWGMVKQNPLGWILVSGHLSPQRSYLKMDLKSEFFDFWESWDQTGNECVGIFRIRGHLRSLEAVRGQQNLDMWHLFGNL